MPDVSTNYHFNYGPVHDVVLLLPSDPVDDVECDGVLVSQPLESADHGLARQVGSSHRRDTKS